MQHRQVIARKHTQIVFQRLRAVAATMEDELLASLEPDEQVTLRRLLRTLAQSGAA
mgnify:CR=1 FL=1